MINFNFNEYKPSGVTILQPHKVKSYIRNDKPSDLIVNVNGCKELVMKVQKNRGLNGKGYQYIMNSRKNVLSNLIKSGLNFDNGYGYTDDQSYYMARNPSCETSEYMRSHAYKLRKLAIIVADELGINKSKAYVTMYGNSDSVVLSNSNHSYIKITLCDNSEFNVFMGDENYMRPNVRLRKTYGTRDANIEFDNGGTRTVKSILGDAKVSEIVKRFNEGNILCRLY